LLNFKKKGLRKLFFLFLRRQTPEIYYFLETKECDFVVFKEKKLNGLYQVCWQLDTNTMDREISGIMEAMNYFDVNLGTIITLSQTDIFHINGKIIEVHPFYQWGKQ